MSKLARILVVDDEEFNRELLKAILTNLGYETETAADGFEAMAKLNLDIDLVLCDLMMPGMDGYEVAARIRKDPAHADIPICMVTSLSGQEHRLRAVEVGANDFIAKPVDRLEVEVRVRALLKIKEAQDALKTYQTELEETVERRTVALRFALQEMSEAQRATYAAQIETIRRLAVAAEFKDEDTASHIDRMSHYAYLVSVEMGLPPKRCEVIRYSSPMHDIGKLGIPDAILLKPGKLDAEEWRIMRTHAAIGGRILAGSASELLQSGEIIARTHHETWDGSGYPEGLSGEAIPIEGRITAIADVFDALTSRRPYKEPFPVDKALGILEEGRGSHFDPAVVDAFMARIDGILAKKAETSTS